MIAEALVVGPNDFLVIRMGEEITSLSASDFEEMMESFNQTLRDHGLGDRTLVIAGDIELAKVERSE